MGLISFGKKLIGGVSRSVTGNPLGWLGLGASALQSKEDAKQRDEWNKRRIQYTVADAKAAGIHPLFALGTGGATSPILSTGSAIGDSLAQLGRDQRGITAESAAKAKFGLESRVAASVIRRNEAAAKLDLAQASAVHSNAARNAQNLSAQGRDIITDPELGEFESTPPRVPKARPGAPNVQAGQFPGQKRAATPGGVGNWYSEDELGEIATWLNIPNAVAEVLKAGLRDASMRRDQINAVLRRYMKPSKRPRARARTKRQQWRHGKR